MLPERAFQPRDRYGMTREGGGGGIVGDIVGGIGDVVGGAVDFVGDVVGGAVDVVRDVGRDIDDFVNDEIPGGWVTVAAVGTGMYLSGAETAAAAGAAETAGAATAAEAAAAGGAVVTPVAGWGGTVTPIAPISTAVAVPASQLAFPATEIGAISTPVPGSFQAALPSFGVETAASAAPFTAAPGSFQAAIGSGLLASAAPALSLTDAFRTARLASNLMGQPQQPQYPTQQLPDMQAGAVDLLSLPQLRAGVPNVSGLLNPRATSVPVFDFYTGLPTLLG